jgi:hypothetical protein
MYIHTTTWNGSWSSVTDLLQSPKDRYTLESVSRVFMEALMVSEFGLEGLSCFHYTCSTRYRFSHSIELFMNLLSNVCETPGKC